MSIALRRFTPANDNSVPEWDEYSCPPSQLDRIKSRHAAGREGQS